MGSRYWLMPVGRGDNPLGIHGLIMSHPSMRSRSQKLIQDVVRACHGRLRGTPADTFRDRLHKLLDEATHEQLETFAYQVYDEMSWLID